MSSMSAEVWQELQKTPSYTALVGEFSDPPVEEITNRVLSPDKIEDLAAGNISPVESELEDNYSIGQEIAFTVETPGYQKIINMLSDRVKQLRTSALDMSDTAPDKISARHFEAKGAKELLDYAFNLVNEFLDIEKPKSLG